MSNPTTDNKYHKEIDNLLKKKRYKVRVDDHVPEFNYEVVYDPIVTELMSNYVTDNSKNFSINQIDQLNNTLNKKIQITSNSQKILYSNQNSVFEINLDTEKQTEF